VILPRRSGPLRAACLIAIGGIAASAGPSRAEDLPLDEMPEPLPGGVHFGSLSLLPFFRIEELGYDDNVFLSEEGGERSDFTARLAGGVRGQALFGDRGVITFEERPEVTVFLSTSSQNSANNFLEARGDLFVRDMDLYLGGDWSTTRQRPNSEIDERTRVRSRRVFGGIGWGMSRRLSASTSLSRVHHRYTDEDVFATDSDIRDECPPDRALGPGDSTLNAPIGVLLDRKETRGDLRVSYRVFGRTKAFVEFSRGKIDFDDCPGRDSRRYAVLPGFVFGRSASLSGTLKAGPARFDARRSDRRDYRGILGKADLSLRPSERWKLGLRWQRDVPFSIYGNNLFSIEKRGELTVSRALGGRLALEVGGERRNVRWPEGDNPRKDRIQSYFVGTRVRLASRADVSFRVGYRRRTSNTEGFADRQVTVMTGAGF
jgi:hypothetical protein